MSYEMVCGLETHVELSTKSKIFCSCTTAFGGDPNTHCCPVCIGLPGTLPRLNRAVVDYAIKAGLATHCRINPLARMDRKNYVYPDLPKAYQISQLDQPLCMNGYIALDSGRHIRIERIQIEEDAGKLVHENGHTLVDYNRCGVPLIEIITLPDIRTVEEAREYMEKLQILMRTIGISDCRMQEGSLRCDVNISLRPIGAEAYGTRTEIKNMSSFSNMARAMRYEVERQAAVLDAGGTIVQETLRFDEDLGVTQSMRSKEDAQDYRFFREPDLVPIRTTPEQIEALRAALPELPEDRTRRYLALGLPAADVQTLVKYPRIAGYFDAACQGIQNPRTVANLLISQAFARLTTESEKEQCALALPAAHLQGLVALFEAGKLRMNLVKSTLEKMLDSGKPHTAFVSEADMAGVDEATLHALCEKAIAENSAAVEKFRKGKENAIMALVGSIMRETRGRADAKAAETLLRQMIAP